MEEHTDMKRTKFFSLLLCGILLCGLASGCSKTQKHLIVREKKAADTKRYEEAELVTGPSEKNALSRRLQVPDTYEASAASDDNSFQLSCHAQVTVPDAAEIPIYQVSQRPFDEAWISQVTKAFFGDAPVYDGETYFQVSKTDALEKINELKAYQAEGNTDPYGIIANLKESGTEHPEEYYSLQEDIASWEQTYQEAPETVEKTEVTPGLSEASGGRFYGAVEVDGGIFGYTLKTTETWPMEIKINRLVSKSGTDYPYWNAAFYEGETKASPGTPSRKEAEEMAGITPDQAIEMTDQYMEKLGLTDFSAKHTALGLCFQQSAFAPPSGTPAYSDAGYLVSYTRDLNGFPVTDESSMGGVSENIDSTTCSWGYEKAEFYVNRDGLQQARLLNLYQIGEPQVSNVKLLSFPEIAEIFEQMARIKYSNDPSPGGYLKLDITDVKLGYMRVYDPGLNSTSGILVPVWDFFGIRESLDIYDGEEQYSKYASPVLSFLTLNAADGTVIDRGKGY